MRATSHARLTVDGVGTKSRDLVQERETVTRRKGDGQIYREKILREQMCNENTSKCELCTAKNIEGNRAEKERGKRGEIFKDLRFILARSKF